MYEWYEYFFFLGYQVTYIVGAIFCALVLIFAYLGGLIAPIIGLFNRGWFKLGAIYGIGYLAIAVYSLIRVYSVVSAGWPDYKFVLAIPGLPVSMALGGGLLLVIVASLGGLIGGSSKPTS
jgi:hypothetical protein